MAKFKRAPSTGLRRDKSTLRESEERFRLMANSAPVLIWMSGRDKLCTWFNQQWLTFVGRTMAHELGNGWAENVHPEDFDRCLQIYTTRFDAREPFSIEYRLRRHDGQWRWVLDNGTPRYDSHKTFVGYIGSCVDITSLRLLQDQQMMAERKLRQRESELAALFDSSPDSHARFDSKLRVTHANAAFEKSMGVSAQALIGKTVRQLPLSEDNRRIAHVLINKVFRTGRSQRYEFSVASTEGVTEYEVRYIPELSTDGSVAAVLGIGRDITEFKNLNQSIRQRESEIVALFDSSPDPHVRYDSNLRVTHANGAFGRMTGISVQTVIGKTRRKLQSPRIKAQAAERSIKEVFQTGQPQRYEISVPSAQGVTEYEVRYVPEFSADGSVAAVLAIGRDITERKRMEGDLRRREQELATLTENSPDVIMRVDRNLRTLYVNATWEKVTGISRETALGKTISKIGLPPIAVTLKQRAIRQVLKSQSPKAVEFKYPLAAGPVDFEVRHIPEFDNGTVSSVLMIGRDITPQKRLQALAAANERDIRALTTSLITAQEQERRRVAREIHDSLCQQLGALAAEIGKVGAGFPASSPAGQRLQVAREHALRSAEEAHQIARQLHPAILEDLGLSKALQNLCREFSQRAGIPVVFRVINPLPEAPIEAASCVYRIAQEALSNVAKHAHAKNVWVRLSGTANLRLSIHDDGIGFDPSAARGGGGLGLVSMEERARIAGATLSIQGRPDHGTRVKLAVPIRGATREKSAHSAGR